MSLSISYGIIKSLGGRIELGRQRRRCRDDLAIMFPTTKGNEQEG
jgi:hypothetical protein